MGTQITSGRWAPWPALAPYARQADLDAVNLFLYEAGDPRRETLLLLHGLGDDADSWRHLLLPLAERYHVLAPDLPGFGRSEKGAWRYSLDFLVRVVQGLYSAEGIGAATVIGSSLGAVIAQELALRAPALVRSLVLLDGSLYLPERSLNLRQLLMFLPGVGEWLYSRLQRDPAAAYATLRPYYADLDGLPAADRAFLHKRVQERVADEAQRRAFLSALRQAVLEGVRRQGRVEAELSRLAQPTLVIWGAADRILPAANATALAETLPAAELLLVPGAGHLPHQERPAAVLAAIRAHLAAASAANGKSTYT